MVEETSPYSTPIAVKALLGGYASGVGLAVRDWFWCSAQSEAWLGCDDFYECRSVCVQYVDVLAARPSEYRKPVFLAETRRELWPGCRCFGKGELLRFLLECGRTSNDALLGSPQDNLFLLEKQQVAVVHWLPAYGVWQLHVTADFPYLIAPGTRLFALL